MSGRDPVPILSTLDRHHAERDAAFVAYCLARTGGALTLADVDALWQVPQHVAAAMQHGAFDRQAGVEPLTRSEVIAAVSAALSESPEAEGEGGPGSPPDATAAALAAYAEGAHDTYDALDLWKGSEAPDPPTLTRWLSARRAAAPRRPMTAGEVLDRVEAWERNPDASPGSLSLLLADLRREIAAR